MPAEAPLFTMMVGLPYSGKSTYAKQLAEEINAEIHSSDAIRAEILGDEQDQTNNDRVFQVLHGRVTKDLSDGKNVIYDATNLNYKRRMNTLRLLKGITCKKRCILMATPFETCVERSKDRKRVVPYDTIERMYKSIWIPDYYEGWDEISIVYPNGFQVKSAAELMDGLRKIPHDNPHHTLSIGDHCIATQRKVWAAYNDMIPEYARDLEVAALLHDIGKPFTKAFVDSKGNPTQIAHYYDHHHVSAYMALFYIPENMNRIYIASLIQWHMRPYEIERCSSEKQVNLLQRFSSLVGASLFHDVMKLHMADVEAH